MANEGERRAVKELTEAGCYLIVKGGGSKSWGRHPAKVDLVALHPVTNLVIQCKWGPGPDHDEWNNLLDLAGATGALPVWMDKDFEVRRGKRCMVSRWRIITTSHVPKCSYDKCGEVVTLAELFTRN